MIRKLKSEINTVKRFFWEKNLSPLYPPFIAPLYAVFCGHLQTLHPLNLMEDQFLQKAVGWNVTQPQQHSFWCH